MTDIRNKRNELDVKYDPELTYEGELVEKLKEKFPEQFKLAVEDLKSEGEDDPEGAVTPGRFVDHIGNKGEEFLKEYEAILKKLNGE